MFFFSVCCDMHVWSTSIVFLGSPPNSIPEVRQAGQIDLTSHDSRNTVAVCNRTEPLREVSGNSKIGSPKCEGDSRPVV